MTIPLMHGSTSPLKKVPGVLPTAVVSDQRHRPTHLVATRVDPEVTQQHETVGRGRPGLATVFGPVPVSRPVAGIGITPPRGEQRASLPRAVVALQGQQTGTHPSVATCARSAATTSAGASARSRNACHRMEGRHPASSPARSWARASKPPEETVVEWRVSRPGGVGLRAWPGTGQPRPSPPEPTGPAVTRVPYVPVR
jgi:hypothetical protein